MHTDDPLREELRRQAFIQGRQFGQHPPPLLPDPATQQALAAAAAATGTASDTLAAAFESAVKLAGLVGGTVELDPAHRRLVVVPPPSDGVTPRLAPPSAHQRRAVADRRAARKAARATRQRQRGR